MATKGTKTLEEVKIGLEKLNKVSGDYKFAAVTQDDVIFLEKNAHYMAKEQLEKLTNNIQKDGFLSQLPFCMKIKKTGKFIILSGNHRCKAAFKANLSYIIIQYIDEVDRDKALAFQLSHNSIKGQDDMTILKELYREIESLEAKEYSAIDEKEIMSYDSITLPPISEADIKLHEIRFIFSSVQLKTMHLVEEKLNTIEEALKEEEVVRFIGIPFKEFVRVLTDVKERHGIKNNTVGFVKMLKICVEHLADKEQNTET